MDASFLYLEREHAPMHIGAVGIFEGELDFEAYRDRVGSKLGALPRFRERIVNTPFFIGHPTWETDPGFDISNHVVLHHLEAPGTEVELKALADDLIAGMMDRSRPLWELHIVHGLAGGRSGLVSKVHHAMVDGVGGNQIMTTILDLRPSLEKLEVDDDYIPTEPPDFQGRIMNAVWENARTAVDSFSQYQKKMIEGVQQMSPDRARETMDSLRTSMPTLARPPRRLPFNRTCTGRRHFTWTEFSFAEARAVRGSLGGTVNDVVLTCLAGAVDHYCAQHGEPTKDRTMRVMVPVNVRPETEEGNLGNQVSVLPVDLPLGVDDPAHRIGLIRETTRAMKRSRVAENVSLMSNLLGTVPVPLQAAFGSLAISPYPVFNIVCTNVPGPQIPLYALDRPLRAYYPYIPVGFDMGVGCAIFSYNQTLHIGLNSDLSACPDVEVLREGFEIAIAELKESAGVGTIAAVEVAPPRGDRAADPVGSRSGRSSRPTARKAAPKKATAKTATPGKAAPKRKAAKRKASTGGAKKAGSRSTKSSSAGGGS